MIHIIKVAIERILSFVQFFAFKSMVSWLCMPIHICSKLQFLLSYNIAARCGVTDAAIRKRIKKLRAILLENEEIKNFFENL